MTTDLPDPHGCPHCGFPGLAERWGETICGMCGAPRVHAEPGCPVRNVLATDLSLNGVRITCDGFLAESVTAETAREAAEDERRTIAAMNAEPNPMASLIGVADETARERRVHDGGPRTEHGYKP